MTTSETFEPGASLEVEFTKLPAEVVVPDRELIGRISAELVVLDEIIWHLENPTELAQADLVTLRELLSTVSSSVAGLRARARELRIGLGPAEDPDDEDEMLYLGTLSMDED